ncbi:SapC family protein [Alteromonas oceanisediminis]|uniref:SapC family protein n=1 Tax=Alteromonas oceanisediminis TaxID=2836180 RepID=UPI001BDB5E23|nr:SapC family protein [Alteromonas oceanisediminis]MBT0587412.1 SapC family protein [Alteromonas oceanisediminis]
MPDNHQVLDNVTHKDIKIDLDKCLEQERNQSFARVFPSEFRMLHTYFPLFFQKRADTGKFEAIAVFGFSEQQNLCVDKPEWRIENKPLTLRRQPFLIGFQTHEQNGVPMEEPVVFIDMHHPGVNRHRGTDIFLPQGGQSAYLTEAASTLNAIHVGHTQLTLLVDNLLKYQLLESVNITVTLDNGETRALNSLYTIHEENLASLDANALQVLHSQGHLQAIYCCVLSANNLSRLIDYQNAFNQPAGIGQ